MKHSYFPRSLSFTLVAASLAIVGCGGISHIPDTITDADSPLPAIHGRVYGGHAPLIGAHVYLLQVGSGALGASSSSLLGTGSTSSPGGFTLQTNVSDPHIPAGWQYVLTDSKGEFNLTNAYQCGSNQPVYIYAYGGAPTTPSAPEPNNPAVVNLATLGVCPFNGTFAGSISYIYLNEVSTVATAYAFQGFTSSANNDAVHIGYSGAVSSVEAQTGIQNAAGNTFQLYDIGGSVANQDANFRTYGPGPNLGAGVVPQATLDTLANILATCVDSGNSASVPNTTCTVLFHTATADGTAAGTQPTDTATAAINIARHPAGVGAVNYASTLWGLLTGPQPFSPSLSSPPPDFTIAIQYPSSSNSLFTAPRSIALDSNGDFWFTNWVTPPVPGTNTYGSGNLAEASPLGAIMTSHLNSTYAMGNIAMDSNDNAWVGTVNVSQSFIYEDGPTTHSVFKTYNPGFTAAEAPAADNSTTSGALYFTHGPTCILPPLSCNGVADNNAELTEVLSNGSTTGSSPNFTFPEAAFVTHAAMDSAGYEWMTSDTPTYGNAITRVTKGGAVAAAASFPITPGTPSSTHLCGAGWIAPEQPAIDRDGNAWIPINGLNGGGTGVFTVNPAGTSCTYHNTEGGLLVGPYGAAIDGANNVWIANSKGGTAGMGSLAELSATTGANLSTKNFQPVSSAGANLLNGPLNLAVDVSGDIFVTNYSGNSIVEFIGLATPLYGPLGVAAGTCAGSPLLCKIAATP